MGEQFCYLCDAGDACQRSSETVFRGLRTEITTVLNDGIPVCSTEADYYEIVIREEVVIAGATDTELADAVNSLPIEACREWENHARAALDGVEAMEIQYSGGTINRPAKPRCEYEPLLRVARAVVARLDSSVED